MRRSRHARDPRSRLELRRLALKAKRDPSLLPILHDALLETYPSVYGWYLEKAQDQSRKGSRRPQVVVFKPRLLSNVKDLGISYLFYVKPASEALTTPSDVVVYSSVRRPKRKS